MRMRIFENGLVRCGTEAEERERNGGLQSNRNSRESTHTSLDRPAARAEGSVTLQNGHN